MVGCADMTAMAAGLLWQAFWARFAPISHAPGTSCQLPVKRLRTIHRLASANSVF